ncbi:hypothetical protein [Terrabacter sp. 2YAF2]|uniref:hypothetical protein n=1 Tax=Terrabacter sp. 2YAF2 TaxID=3233026 RepID=UPI003F95FC4A
MYALESTAPCTYAVLTRNGAGDSALSEVVQATPVAAALTVPGAPTAFHAAALAAQPRTE